MSFTTTIGAPIPGPSVDLPLWAKSRIDLANPRLGAKTLFCTDDFFAPMERMINPEAPVFIPGQYDDNGKWMDGWETRRKRSVGYDWGFLKLGRKGTIHGFDIDTSHFTGNFAPAISIDATLSNNDAVDALKAASWTEILPSMSLKGNSHHLVEIESLLRKGIWSHLRVNIYPDGGIARLRVYGQPSADSHVNKNAAGLMDLLAMENGGRAISWNDAHFGIPSNMILPGKGINMGDGWETRRRREPGSDWCVLQLGREGVVEEIEVDTAHFKGNFPDRCSIQAAKVVGGTDQSLTTQSMFWQILLPEQKLEMDKVFTFSKEIKSIGAITHVRLNIIPDGGISRLRLWGKAT